jgi:hypothetical protein
MAVVMVKAVVMATAVAASGQEEMGVVAMVVEAAV